MELKTIDGTKFLIDDHDYNLIKDYNFYRLVSKTKTYIQLYKNKNDRHLLHVFIMGKIDGCEIDHIDWNGLNNQRKNLRHVTRSQNNANRKNVKGYYYCTYNKKFRSDIYKDNIKYHIGLFDTEEEAKKAYKKKKFQLYGFY